MITSDMKTPIPQPHISAGNPRSHDRAKQRGGSGIRPRPTILLPSGGLAASPPMGDILEPARRTISLLLLCAGRGTFYRAVTEMCQASAASVIPYWRYHRGMAMDGAGCVTVAIAAGVSPAVALFRSLGDETRLRIVARLAAGEARVVDLTGELGLAQSTVSKHLACLR